MALIKPLVTEKSLRLAKKGQFSFAVDGQMTKNQIAATINDLFKVNAVRVNVINLPAKTRKTGTKRLAVMGNRRYKAIVTLKPGQTIEYFESKEKKSTTKKKKK